MNIHFKPGNFHHGKMPPSCLGVIYLAISFGMTFKATVQVLPRTFATKKTIQMEVGRLFVRQIADIRSMFLGAPSIKYASWIANDPTLGILLALPMREHVGKHEVFFENQTRSLKLRIEVKFQTERRPSCLPYRRRVVYIFFPPGDWLEDFNFMSMNLAKLRRILPVESFEHFLPEESENLTCQEDFLSSSRAMKLSLFCEKFPDASNFEQLAESLVKEIRKKKFAFIGIAYGFEHSRASRARRSISSNMTLERFSNQCNDLSNCLRTIILGKSEENSDSLMHLDSEHSPPSNSCFGSKTPANSIYLNVTTNKLFNVHLHSALFGDVPPGHPIAIQLNVTWQDGRVLSNADLIQFSSSLGLIYGWISVEKSKQQPDHGFTLAITATDRCMNDSTVNLTIAVANRVMERCTELELMATSQLDPTTPYVHIAESLMRTLLAFYNDTEASHHVLVDFSKVELLYNTFLLRFSDTSVKCQPCDYSAYRGKIGLSLDLQGRLRTNFLDIFKPSFAVIAFTANLSICSDDSAPIVLNPIPHLQLNEFGRATHTIANNTFLDAEDGYTANLYLQIRKVTHQNAVIAILRGIRIEIFQVSMSESGSVQFVLSATDSQSKSVDTYVTVTTRPVPIRSFGSFDFAFLTFFVPPVEPHVALENLIALITVIVGDETWSRIFVVSYEFSGYYPQEVRLIWSNTTFSSVSNEPFLLVQDQLFDSQLNLKQDIRNRFFPKVTVTLAGSSAYEANETEIFPTLVATNSFQTSIVTTPFVQSNAQTLASAISYSLSSSNGKFFHIPITSSPSVASIRPPSVMKVLEPVNASFCDFLIYMIPDDLFLDPVDGGTRNLQLRLLLNNGAALPRNSWVSLSADIQVVYGFLKFSDFTKQYPSAFEYQIEATNSRNLSTFASLVIRLPFSVPPIYYTMQLKVNSFYSSDTPEINELLQLILKVARYFGAATYSWVNVLSFVRNESENYVSFVWTNCTLSTDATCPTALISELRSNVAISDSMVNPKFASFLAPQYVVYNVSSAIRDECNIRQTSLVATASPGDDRAPKVNQGIGIIEVLAGHVFRYKIPYETFYDSGDGYTPFLLVHVRNEDGTYPSKTSWLQFNQAAQELYGMLFAATLGGASSKTFLFRITATNSKGMSVTTNFHVKGFLKSLRITGAVIGFHGSQYFSSGMNDIQVLIVMTERLKSYMEINDSTTEILIFNKDSWPPGNFFLQLAILVSAKDDCARTSLTIAKILSHDGTINQFLNIALIPDALVTAIDFAYVGLCTQASKTLLPSPTALPLPRVLNRIPQLTAKVSSIFRYFIPENTFIDDSDGSTGNLLLSLLAITGTALAETSWVLLFQSSRELIGVLSKADLATRTSVTFEYLLRATNSRGYSTDLRIEIVALDDIPQSGTLVTMTGTDVFANNEYSLPAHLYLINNIKRYFVPMPAESIYTVEFLRTRGLENKFVFKWGTSKISPVDCSSQDLQFFIENLLTNDGQVEFSFQSSMAPSVKISSIKIHVNCETSPSSSFVVTPTPSLAPNQSPVVVKLIPALKVEFCRSFFYLIPSDTFRDNEDGDTRNLKLKLYNPNGTLVGTSSWIQLNEGLQILYGILKYDDYERQLADGYEFLLEASDSKMASVNTKVQFTLPERQFSLFYIATLQMLRFVDSTVSEINEQFILITKISNFLADPLFMTLQPISFSRDKASRALTYSWTFCLETRDGCPHEQVLNISRRLFLSREDRKVTEQFRQALLPQFAAVIGFDEFAGVCRTMMTATIHSSHLPLTSLVISTGPSHRNHPPYVNTKVPTLRPSLYEVFQFHIPGDAFFDAEDGYTPNLRLKLTNSDERDLGPTSWIHFDSEKRLIVGVLRDDILSSEVTSQNYRLTATDSGGLSTYQVISLSIPAQQTPPAYRFWMKFTWLRTSPAAYLLTEFYKHITTFNPKEYTPRFISYNEMQLSLTWSEYKPFDVVCNHRYISRTSHHFLAKAGNADSSFARHVSSLLSIQSLLLDVHPACQYTSKLASSTLAMSLRPASTPRPNLPPSVLRTLPDLIISPCQPLSYIVPDDTFFDFEDGPTRNLKLQLLNLDFSELGSSAWVYLNSTSLLISGAITSELARSVNHAYFQLMAQDKGGLKTHQTLNVLLDQLNHTSYFSFNITAEQNFPNSSVFLISTYALDKIQRYLFKESFERVYLRSVAWSGEASSRVAVTFSTCYLSCLEGWHLLSRKLLNTAVEPNKKLVDEFLPFMRIKSVNIDDHYNCHSPLLVSSKLEVYPTPHIQNTPPYFLLLLPKFHLSACSLFSYNIPERTCIDREDGLARSLNLSLTFTNGSDVGSHYWLVLNKTSQQLYAVLKESDLFQKESEIQFLIHCHDREGLSASQVVTFFLPKKSMDPKYSITVKSYVYFEWPKTDVEILALWISKAMRQFNNKNDTFPQIISLEHIHVNSPQIIISWHYCSVEDPCAPRAQEIKARIFAFDSLLSPRFTRAMVPEFVLISGRFSQNKPCLTTSSALLPSASVIQNRPPLVLRPNILIEISFCKFFTYHVPFDTFLDEDGDAKHLTIRILDKSGNLLPKSSWFNYKPSELVIYGYPSLKNFKDRHETAFLEAMDSRGLRSKSVLEIFSSEDAIDPFHFFSASALIQEPFPGLADLVTLLAHKINTYLRDQQASSLAFRTYNLQDNLLTFEWSNCTLASACNNHAIKKLSSKLFNHKNVISQTFVSHLGPEFLITTLYVGDTEACTQRPSTTHSEASRSLSQTSTVFPTPIKTNTHPRVETPLPEIQVPTCSSFSFRIPENTHLDLEDGDTRDLKLSLLSPSGGSLSNTSWIDFDQSTQILYGQVRLEMMGMSEMTVYYILRAHDSDGLYVDASVKLVIAPKPRVGFLLSVWLINLSPSIAKDLTTQLDLVSKLASYSSDPDTSLVAVYSFVTSAAHVEMKWTHCSYLNEDCAVSKNTAYREKFINEKGEINAYFARALLPFYSIYSASISYLQTCSPTTLYPTSTNPTFSVRTTLSSIYQVSPTVKVDNPPRLVKRIPQIVVTRCQSFSYYLAEDMFVDEDGTISALRLTLKDAYGHPLPKSSWVLLNSNLNAIYGFIKEQDIISQPEGGFVFALTAGDSKGQETSTDVHFKIPERLPAFDFRVSLGLRRRYMSSYPMVNELHILSSIIAQFFRTSLTVVVQPIDLYESGPDLLHFEWTNCSSLHSSCQKAAVLEMKRKIVDEHERTRKAFAEVFLPQFELQESRVKIFTECELNSAALTTTSLPLPTPAALGRPVLYKPIPRLELAPCSTFEFTIPWDTFYDGEDGFTRSLNLTATFVNGSEIPSRYWIQFSTSIQAFQGIPSRIVASMQSTNGHVFSLTARDSDGHSVSALVTIFIHQQYPTPMQNVTMHLFQNTFKGKEPEELSALVSARIALYFANTDARFVDVLSIHLLNTGEFVYQIVWSNCSNSASSCDLVKHRLLRQDGLWKPEFAQCFLPEFILTWLAVDTDDSCSAKYMSSGIPFSPSILPTATPVSRLLPKANYNLTIRVSYCGRLVYHIPENLFSDAQGGGTSKFRLELLFLDATTVNCASWLQLDSERQVLYGTPIPTQRNLLSEFFIRAQDSSGHKALARLSLQFELPLASVVHKISLSFKSFISARTCSAQVLLTLQSKLETYFGHNSRNLSVLFFARGENDMQNYVMWTNCSLRERPCDFITVHSVRKKLFAPEGLGVNDDLVSSLGPEFHSFSAVEELLGECSVNRHPVVANKLRRFDLQICGILSYQIPADTFYDAEDGYTRQLTVKAFNLDGSGITPDSWFQFDEYTQTVYGVPTTDTYLLNSSRVYSILLKAADVEAATASDILELGIVGQPDRKRYSFLMVFKCQHHRELTLVSTVIRLMAHLATRIIQVPVSDLTLMTFSGTHRNVIMTWSMCQPSSINRAFRNYNLSDFRETGCSLRNWDILEDWDHPPKPTIPNLHFIVQHCEQVRYKLQLTTFVDKETGDIRNLQLRIAHVDGRHVPPLFWIVYDARTYELLIAPSLLGGGSSQFLLVAADSAGQVANVSIFISIADLAPSMSFVVTIKFRSYSNSTVLSNIFDFSERLKAYLSTSSPTFLIESWLHAKDKAISFSYGNCSLRYDPCDYEAVANISSLLLAGNSTNLDFFKFMLPQFEVMQAQPQKNGPCLVPQNDAPFVVKPVGPLELPTCSILHYRIPEDVFYDKQDGWTRNLSLKLFDAGNHEIKDGCWIDFDTSAQAIRASITDEVFSLQRDGWIFVHIQATDSLGAAVNTSIQFKVPEKRLHSFEVTLLVEILDNDDASCMVHKLLLQKKLQTLYNHTLEVGVRSLAKSTNNMYAEIVFVNCLLRYKPCNYIAVDEMIRMVQSRQRSIAPVLTLAMRPEYEPKYVSGKVSPPCEGDQNTGPVQVASLDLPEVSVCQQLSYKLPRNLLIDLEDGDIYEMKGVLINSTIDLEVLPTSWIHVNDDTKILHIVPTAAMAELYINKSQYFKIKAIDSRQAAGFASFSLNFTSTIINTSFEVDMNVTSALRYQSAAELLAKLSERIMQAFDIPPGMLKMVRYALGLSSKFSNTLIVWSTCYNDGACDYETLSKISRVMQTKVLADLLGAGLTVHTCTVKKFRLCTEPPNKPPVAADAILNVTINSCAGFSLQIPAKAFVDDRDGYTRNLTVSLFPTRPATAMIFMTFDAFSQTLEGFLPIALIEHLSYIEFRVTATDSGGLQGHLTLRLYVTTYIFPLDIFIGAVTHFGTFVTDLHLLRSFMNSLRSYLGLGNESLALVNFFRREQDLRKHNITVGVCLGQAPCNYTEIDRLLNLLQQDGKPRFSFISNMLPDIVPEFVDHATYGACADSPPRPHKSLKVLQMSLCRFVEYQIPEDAFVDDEDGGTRNLSLKLLPLDPQVEALPGWIDFDETRQVVRALPLMEALTRSEKQFSFRLKAEDLSRNVAFQVIHLILLDNVEDINYLVNVTVMHNASGALTNFQLGFLIAKKVHEMFTAMTLQISAVSVDRWPHKSSWLSILLVDCNSLNQSCNIFSNDSFASSFVLKRKETVEAIRKAMHPDFLLLNASGIKLNKCKNVSDSPMLRKSIPPLTVTLCSRLEYGVPKDSFYDLVDGDLSMLKAQLLTMDQKPIGNHEFVDFEEDSKTIYAHLTQSDVSSLNQTSYFYILRVEDSDGNSVDAIIKINLIDIRLDNSFVVEFLLEPFIHRPLSRTRMLFLLTNKISSHFLDSNYSFISIINISMPHEFKPIIKLFWTNCTFQNGICLLQQLHIMQSKIFSPISGPSPYLINSMYREFKLIQASATSYGPCLHKYDSPPEARENVTVLVPSCGLFAQRVAASVFFDEEDGSARNLQLKLATHDKQPIPHDSWIGLRLLEQEIYGIAPTLAKDQVQFALIATDSANKTATTIVTVKVDSLMQIRNSFRVFLNCNRSYEKIHLLPVISKLLETIRFAGSSVKHNFSLIGVDSIDKSIHVNLTVCTSELLDESHFSTLIATHVDDCILVSIKVSNLGRTSLASASKEASIGNFHTSSIVFYSSSVVPRISDSDPVTLNSIGTLVVQCGVPFAFFVPPNTFYDREDGLTRNLTLDIQDLNEASASLSWILFNKTEQAILLSVPSDSCIVLDSKQFFSLRATDSSGNYVYDTFKITRSVEVPPSCCYAVHVTLNHAYGKAIHDVAFHHRIYKAVGEYVRDHQNIRIIGFRLGPLVNTTTLVFTNGSLANESCSRENVDFLSRKIFTADGSVNKFFAESLLEFGFLNAKEVLNPTCNLTLAPTMQVITSSPSLEAFTSSEDWLMYLIPLFVLAGGLLFVAVGFFVVRACWSQCCAPYAASTSRADKNLNVAAPGLATGQAIADEEQDPLSNSIEDMIVKADVSTDAEAPELNEAENAPGVASMPGAYYNPNANPSWEPIPVDKRPNPSQNDAASAFEGKVIGKKPRKPVQLLPTPSPRRLPAVPPGPPPPYSPPRRNRLFVENLLPTYYERYTTSAAARAQSPVLIPVRASVPIEFTANHPVRTANRERRQKKESKKTDFRGRLGRFKNFSEKTQPVVQIPLSETSSVSESSALTMASSAATDTSGIPIRIQGNIKASDKILSRLLANSPISVIRSKMKSKRKRLSKNKSYELRLVERPHRSLPVDSDTYSVYSLANQIYKPKFSRLRRRKSKLRPRSDYLTQYRASIYDSMYGTRRLRSDPDVGKLTAPNEIPVKINPPNGYSALRRQKGRRSNALHRITDPKEEVASASSENDSISPFDLPNMSDNRRQDSIADETLRSSYTTLRRRLP